MDVREVFFQKFKGQATILVRAPGRVSLLGEHVDYNAGPVLPMAIDRQVTLLAKPTAGDIVTIIARDLDQRVTFNLSQLDRKEDLDGFPLPSWGLYPAGVARSLRQAGLGVRGADILITSDIPIGAGLSSSAAVEVAFGVLWSELGGWKIERLELARLCQQAENEYVGVSCGLMDQFASACGVEGHALYFDTRSLEWEPAPLPDQTAIVIADSGVRRSLAASAYNERRAACERAVELLRQYKPELETLRDIKTTEFMAYYDYLPPEVSVRAEHVVKEIARVESGLGALKRGDAAVFGALMFAGHASLRDLYEVSTPELDTLVQIARQLPGCYGARLTGAGFGGCTVNLVDERSAEVFISKLQDEYTQYTGRKSQIYLCRASQGAAASQLYP
jgi:galactokinase